MCSKSLRTKLVLAPNPCIITNMHYHFMHYELVNCTMYEKNHLRLAFACDSEGGGVGNTLLNVRKKPLLVKSGVLGKHLNQVK